MEKSTTSIFAVQALTFVGRERKTKILSDEVRDIFQIVNLNFLCTIVGFFGIFSNSVNIAIFLRQGFKSTMNIAFFALAISDLCSLLTLQWFNICMNPLFQSSGVHFSTSEIQYLTAGWPRSCFGRITSWITVYVTAERCLCIAVPLKVKHIITPRRATIVLAAIYILNILTLLPEYSTSSFGWKFYPHRNKTLLGLVFTESRPQMQSFQFFLHAILGLMAFVSVILFTCILVFRLKEKTNWRKTVTANVEQSVAISNRDKKTIAMIVLISTALIVLYTPTTILSMVTFFYSDFSISGSYVNLFVATWSFAFLCEAVNSSVNVFLYYNMSSKFRETFQLLFTTWCWLHSTNKIPSSATG